MTLRAQDGQMAQGTQWVQPDSIALVAGSSEMSRAGDTARACGKFSRVCIVCAISAGVPPRLSENPLNACHNTKLCMRVRMTSSAARAGGRHSRCSRGPPLHSVHGRRQIGMQATYSTVTGRPPSSIRWDDRLAIAGS